MKENLMNGKIDEKGRLCIERAGQMVGQNCPNRTDKDFCGYFEIMHPYCVGGLVYRIGASMQGVAYLDEKATSDGLDEERRLGDSLVLPAVLRRLLWICVYQTATSNKSAMTANNLPDRSFTIVTYSPCPSTVQKSP